MQNNKNNGGAKESAADGIKGQGQSPWGTTGNNWEELGQRVHWKAEAGLGRDLMPRAKSRGQLAAHGSKGQGQDWDNGGQWGHKRPTVGGTEGKGSRDNGGHIFLLRDETKGQEQRPTGYNRGTKKWPRTEPQGQMSRAQQGAMGDNLGTKIARFPFGEFIQTTTKINKLLINIGPRRALGRFIFDFLIFGPCRIFVFFDGAMRRPKTEQVALGSERDRQIVSILLRMRARCCLGRPRGHGSKD